MIRADVAVIGAGMAGASLAAEIAPHASVVLIEAEAQPGYHATGRSAAFWTESYGGPGVQPLTTASGAAFAAPPPGFSDRGFLTPRGALHLASADAFGALDAFADRFAGNVRLEVLDDQALRENLPGLRAGAWRGILEASTADIDVAALHAAFLRSAALGGVTLLCSAPMREARREGARWRIETGQGVIEVGMLANAAGAWADTVAGLSGARPAGIRPYRRTIAQLRVDPPTAPGLPLVIDAGGRYYFKPEPGGRLWLSPHDEEPAAPGDAAPEELAVATAVDRLGGVVDWRVERVERAWAGLRSFAPDRLPVYGFAPDTPGFFWFAGQGGFGIQTAPAAAKLAAAVLLGRTPETIVSAIDPARYAPDRLFA